MRIHHRDDLRKRNQRFDARVPVLLGQCIVERRTAQRRGAGRLQPTRGIDHFERIGRSGQDIGQQRVGIKRDRRQGLIELLGRHDRRADRIVRPRWRLAVGRRRNLRIDRRRRREENRHDRRAKPYCRHNTLRCHRRQPTLGSNPGCSGSTTSGLAMSFPVRKKRIFAGESFIARPGSRHRASAGKRGACARAAPRRAWHRFPWSPRPSPRRRRW